MFCGLVACLTSQRLVPADLSVVEANVRVGLGDPRVTLGT